MSPHVRALRGATTVDADTAEQVLERTVALLDSDVRAQRLDHDDLISVLFTATDDIHSMFPALAARKFGLGDVPLICARELDIDGGKPLCIRVLMHIDHRAGPRRAAPRLPRGCGRPARRPAELSVVRHGRRCGAARPGRSVTGLIGGSIGLGPARAGLARHRPRSRRAHRPHGLVELGALDAVGDDAEAEITFVATPVGADRRARSPTPWPRPPGLVTDVGSVKTPMLDLMADPRYVGGHPMAGSELEGVDGARADLFEGATWVLTPVPGTDDQAFATVRTIVIVARRRGGGAPARAPRRHGGGGFPRAAPHRGHPDAPGRRALRGAPGACLRLAAGGFRDMTRIAAAIRASGPTSAPRTAWPSSTSSIGSSTRSGEVRDIVADADRDGLLAVLEQARRARIALPARVGRGPRTWSSSGSPIPDRKGALAPIFTLATELDVSIADIEIAHSTEGDEGVLILLVDAELGERLQGGAHGDAAHRPVAAPDRMSRDPRPGRAARPRAVDATVAIPGSKSITNRALVCAALAHGNEHARRRAVRRRHRGHDRLPAPARRRASSPTGLRRRHRGRGHRRRGSGRADRAGRAPVGHDRAVPAARARHRAGPVSASTVAAAAGPPDGRRGGRAQGARRRGRGARRRRGTCPSSSQRRRLDGEAASASRAAPRASSSRACCWPHRAASDGHGIGRRRASWSPGRTST